MLNFKLGTCLNSTYSATLVLEDTVNHQINSTPITINIGNTNINLGTIQACGLSTNETVMITYNGNTYQNSGTPIGYYFKGITKFSSSLLQGIYQSSISLNTSGSSIGNFATSFTIAENFSPFKTYSSLQGSTVTFTEYGTASQYVAGNFSGTMSDSTSPSPINVTGTFRVKRIN